MPGDLEYMGGLTRRWLVAAAITAAVLPVAVAAVRGARNGWMPVWDNAYPAIRAWDVFTANPPLLGTRSMATDLAEHPVNHPGPLEFYALAPWVRLFGHDAGTALGVAFVNISSILTVAWLAFRRGGHVVTTLAMTVMAVLAWSMGSQMLFDPWPPHVTLLPFAVVLVAGWSVADRDLAALPAFVVSGSFVLQTHLGYIVLVPGIILTAVALLAWRLVAERRTASAEGWRATRRTVGRWTAIGVATGLVCWAAPLYQQIARPGGNFTFLLEAAGSRGEGATYSLGSALRLFAATIALPPWWLPPSIDSPAVSPAGRGVALPVALVLLGGLLLLLAIGARRARRRGHLTVATGLGFTALVTVLTVISMANAPSRLGLTVVAYLRFAWVVAAFVTMMLALAVRDELVAQQWTWGRRRAVPVLSGAAVVAGLLALPTADRAHTAPQRVLDGTRELADRVVPAVEDQGPVLVEMGPAMSGIPWFGPGLLVELQAAGVPVVVNDRELIAQLGEHRTYEDGQADLRLYVAVGEDPPLFAHARLIAGIDGRTEADDAELERLHATLRRALDDAGGLPIDDSVPLADDLAGLVDDVRAVGTDPDALLDSSALSQLVAVLDMMGLTGEVIHDFPVDDLVRFEALRALPEGRDVQIWLERLDRG